MGHFLDDIGEGTERYDFVVNGIKEGKSKLRIGGFNRFAKTIDVVLYRCA